MTSNFIIEHFNDTTLCSYRKTNNLENIELHLHNHFEMNLFLNGDIHFFIDNFSFKPEMGTLICINNTQIHGPTVLSSELEYERAIIHFSPKTAQSLSTSKTDLLDCFKHPSLTSRLLTPKEIEAFIDLTTRLEKIQNTHELYGDDVLINSYLTQLLVMANKVHNKNHSQEIKIQSHLSLTIQEVILFIQNNFSDNLTLDLLEHKFNINKHHLNRLFKKELGITIHNYILLTRISFSKKLLMQGLTPTEIFGLIGFKDYNTFARAFKRVTGVSPIYYKKNQ